MPIEKMSADTVFKRLLANKNRVYPSKARGAERLSPYAQPHFAGDSSLDKDAAIFASGSCFARNVEKSLKFIGANVISSPTNIPTPKAVTQVSQLFNKYTVHSILNELRWALGDEKPDFEKLLVEDKKTGLYYDLQVSASAQLSGPLDEMLAFRSGFNASFARASEADLVIITLGLVECWYDTENEVYLNTAPPKPLTLQYPGRFEFHLLDYNDVYAALEEIHSLLSSRSTPAPKMLFTVSPVGLRSTFRSDDVLVANCYSKSVQRAAVEAFVANHEATYFPSYEYVTLTDCKFAWGNRDFRHVRQETVDRIMADVLLAYFGPSPEQELLYLRGHATARFDNREYEKVIDMIEASQPSFDDNAEIMWLYARSLRSAGRQQDALDVFQKVMGMDAGISAAAGRTAINLARLIKSDDLVPQLIEQHVAKFPTEQEWAETLKSNAK